MSVALNAIDFFSRIPVCNKDKMHSRLLNNLIVNYDQLKKPIEDTFSLCLTL